MLILVFPDGETFSTLEGCMISEIDDDLELEEAEEAIADDQEAVLYTFKDDDTTRARIRAVI